MKQGFTLLLWLTMSVISRAQVEVIPHIDSANIQSVRQELFDVVYGDEPIPEFQLLDTTPVKSMLALSYPPKYMGSLEIGVVSLKHGFTSKIYIIHPEKDNGLNVPIIYHSGHGYGVFREDVLVNYDGLTIDYFLSRGFTVVGVDMPFFGENKSPVEVNENGQFYPMWGHADLFYLENPFYYFMAPIKSAIDYLQTNRNCNEFIMYGLSGGGWSTTLYSALDPRVRLSFPVAGSIPMPLRQERDMGDMEQFYPPFYEQFNYSTLYFLGSAGKGRKQYQILIKKDQCCFAYDGGVLWKNQVNNALKKGGMPGSFEFFFDTVSNSHRISLLAIDSIHLHIIVDAIDEKLNEMFLLSSSRESNTICENDTMQLKITGSGSNEVEWFRNGDKIDTAASYSVTVGEEGNYNATVRNLSGGVISMPAIEVKRQNMFSQPVITRSGDKLYSSYSSGNTWYFNGQQISGAGTAVLQLSKPGRYSLRVSSSMCTSEYSEPFDFGVAVFPNPSSSKLTVRLTRDLQAISWSLRTVQGSEVMKGEFLGETVISYNNTVQRGIYFLVLKNRSGFSSIQKIVVNR